MTHWRMILFNCLSACHIDYCVSAYCNFITTHAINSLNSRLSQCGRSIIGISAPNRNSDVLSTLNILNYQNRTIYQQLLVIYKIIHFKVPLHLYVSLTSPTHSHNTRFANSCLTTYWSNKRIGEASFKSWAPNLYNKYHSLFTLSLSTFKQTIFNELSLS